MRPFTTASLGSVAISDPVIIDYTQGDFNLGLAINVVSGTNTSSVEFSLDDPNADYATSYNTNATWFPISALAAKTADTAASHTIPCRAVRLNMTAWTSGTANLTVIQGHN